MSEADLHRTILKLERIIEIQRAAMDRLALCPDHRDKATGVCIVCQAELRGKLQERERHGA
jgi:hypothetical protein